MKATGRDTSRRRGRRLRAQVNAERGRSALYVLGLVLFGASMAIVFVWFHSAQVRMGRDVDRLRRDFALRAKEAANLRVQLESFRDGSYIKSAVRRFGLGLRPPMPGQVRRVYPGAEEGRDVPTLDVMDVASR